MSKLYLDIETFSEQDIRAGVDRYAHHPSTEILLIAWAYENEPVQVVDLTRGDSMPHTLLALYNGSTNNKLVIHNAAFDRTVLNVIGERYGLDYLPAERVCDTMVQALSHGLPGALGMLGQVFGLAEEESKVKEGRQLIHVFCKPYRGERTTPADRPAQWERFVEYARRDVSAMRTLHGKLPQWNYPGTRYFTSGEPSAEHALWCLDQEINSRGFKVDLDLVHAAIDAAKEEKQLLDVQIDQASGGEVGAATQRNKLLLYILQEHGVALSDLRQDTLMRLVDDESLAEEVRELLRIRINAGRNSSAKYKAVASSVSADGRLRNSLQFAGAQTTGRWSGRVFQPQNLMRPTMPAAEIEQAIEDIKDGTAGLLYTNLAEVLGNAVRGVLVAPEGHKLVCCDLKSIEGRALAWLAKDDRILQFYRDFDNGAVSYDSYQLAYSQVFGGNPAEVTKAERQIGKPIELAFGYGGGVAAFRTFAATYHLNLNELANSIWTYAVNASPASYEHLQDCKQKYEWAKEHGYDAGLQDWEYAAFEYVKQKWRAARQPTEHLWQDLRTAFMTAVNYENETVRVGVTELKMRRSGQWLRLRLPSGRSICFIQPKVDVEGALSYAGLDRESRKWTRVFTHGGKLAGICTQALARDVLAANMPIVQDAGYKIVLSVHDELITETPDNPTFSAERLEHWMTRTPAWADGLPLAADGFETYRYRKGD